jgi:hypothetical protein
MAVINTHTYLDAVYIWGFRFLSKKNAYYLGRGRNSSRDFCLVEKRKKGKTKMLESL